LTSLYLLCKTDNNSSYMATSFSSNKTSFNKIFIIVFGVALGLMALAMGFKGVQNTSDIRSRAATVTTMVKRWEFNGTSAEGWMQSQNPMTVKNGALTFDTQFKSAITEISNTTSFVIPMGIRSLQMRMRIVRPSTGITENRLNPTLSAVSVPVEIHFQKKGAAYEDFSKSTLFIKAIADGQWHSYTVAFPDTLMKYPVERTVIRINGSAIQPRASVAIDWIRISVQRTTPTPTPTPTSLCRVTLKSYSVTEPCGTDLFRYVKYACSDGYTATQGGSTSCKSASVWKQYASEDCMKRRSSTCITPPPVVSCGAITCKIPPPNCYYTNKKPCSCGDLICEASPSARPSSTGGPVPTWVQYTPTPTASF